MGVAFVIPVHTGPRPVAAGTAAAISVVLRAYTDALDNSTFYNNLRAALTAQILTAIHPSFLSALEECGSTSRRGGSRSSVGWWKDSS